MSVSSFDKQIYTFEFDCITFRSLTIDLRNARERLEAYKLIRRLVFLYPQRLPHSFVYVLDAIVSSSQTISLPRITNSTTIIRSDQMVKCCLELLCEIGKEKNPFNYFHSKTICCYVRISSS